jgi:hypothetical protein
MPVGEDIEFEPPPRNERVRDVDLFDMSVEYMFDLGAAQD